MGKSQNVQNIVEGYTIPGFYSMLGQALGGKIKFSIARFYLIDSLNSLTCSVFFRAFMGEIPPPQNNNKFCLFFGSSSHFLSPQKQFPPPKTTSLEKTLLNCVYWSSLKGSNSLRWTVWYSSTAPNSGKIEFDGQFDV